MDWKIVWKATWILLAASAALAAVIATAPWSYLVLIVALMWFLIYDGLMCHREDGR